MSKYSLELFADDSNGNSSKKTENQIEKLSGATLSYNDFFWNYMSRNRPAVITSISDNWPSRTDWITGDENASLNFDYLKTKIGNCQVPIANCSKEYFDSHEKCEMDFHKYLDLWRNGQLNKQNNLYLKDWHLKAKMPKYNFYEVPKYFASDWLNEYLIDKDEDDYRFVYMGPKGTWTPFHSDVFSSFSWSTNIFGLKKWLFVVPTEESKLRDSLNNLPVEVDENTLLENGIQYVTIIQSANESLFVPSGWYHQVWNLTDTISINHNWFNGCNVQRIWSSLATNLQKVIKEIDDCREMDNFDGHCQTMLRASFGMNYPGFLDILEHVTAKRLHCVNNDTNLRVFEKFELNAFHVRFDLDAVHDVVKVMKDDPAIVSNEEYSRRCDELERMTRDL